MKLGKLSFRQIAVNLPFSVSGACLVCLILPRMLKLPWVYGLAALVFIFILFFSNLVSWWRSRMNWFRILTAAVFTVWLGFMCRPSLGWISVLVLAAFSMPASILAAEMTASALNRQTEQQPVRTGADSKKRILLMAVCLVSAAAVMTICSKSSPLYPLNDWVDANCFFTVGKSMLKGLVPYRDLYEQKGPLLYMIYAAGAAVSWTSFLGIYFIEILAAGFFLYYSFKTVQLFLPKASLVLVPVTAAFVYTIRAFVHGGGAEELCLPFFAYALYTAFRTIREECLPDWKQSLAIGLTSGCVFWIKFNLTGIYLGWFIFMVIFGMIRRQWATVFRMLGWIILGVVLVSLPIAAYFVINGAVNDLWTVYFYNNLFSYAARKSTETSPNPGIIANWINAWQFIRNEVRQMLPVLLIGWSGLLLMRNRLYSLAAFLMAFGSFAAAFFGHQIYYYYPMVLAYLLPLGLMVIYSVFSEINSENSLDQRYRPLKSLFWILDLLLCIHYIQIHCANLYLIQYDKEDMPQYQFAEIMNQEENPTLLNYHFLDGGFYTASGIVPDNRFFAWLNMRLPEQTESQNGAAESGKDQFVVIRQPVDGDRSGAESHINPEIYKEVAKTVFPFEGRDFEYTLYQRIEE